jgi:sugar phosphate isomerase/epimerase
MEQLLKSMDNKNKVNLGVQLFTVPHMVDQDLRGTLKTISKIGYKEIEFFGPYPSSSDASKKQFMGMMAPMVGLKNHSFFGYSLEETVTTLKEYNLSVPSMHVDISTLRTNVDQIAETAAKLQTKYLIIAAIMQGRESLDDYKKLADEFNGFGKELSKHGMKYAYHNHGYEHIEMDGEIPMDYLIKNTDPNNVQFELDVFWMKAAGATPLDYLEKYPGRFKLLHLKDCKEEFRFSGDGGTPDQWMAGFSKMTDPGDGIYEISKIIKKASEVGVEHYYLERDMAPVALATLQNSYKNMSAMI